MKKFFISGLVLLVIGFAGMTFAKSSSKSSKSSSSKSSKTSSKQKSDAPAKQSDDKTGQKTTRNKTTKTHRCRLPDGKVDHSISQQECQKANGKWVKY